MKKIVIVVVLLMLFWSVFSMKPKKSYVFKPSDVGVSYVEKLINTSGGALVNTWYMRASDSVRGTVVINCGDAGNMSEWFGYAGVFLSENYDVYMFDYRGFGGSSDFAINAENLYYGEFVDDLAAVVGYAKDCGARDITLFGASMGTVVAMEYIKESMDSMVRRVILDSYVRNSQEVAGRVFAVSGKNVVVPVGVKSDGMVDVSVLVLVGASDSMCLDGDLELLRGEVAKCNMVIFDCGHLQAFSKFTELYCDAVYQFLK